ncbi:hypothetical protein ABBQ32_007628 [Trebouxia sp. C0010 RCD-2024]
MRIGLPHHKNARKWGKAVIEFDVPSDLAQLLHTYLGAPRKALLEHHLLIGDACPYVFMDMHGRGFMAAAVLTLYWQKWLVSRAGVPMNPSMCRQVFVDERQSNSATAGPCNQGAAMVMGHSVKQLTSALHCGHVLVTDFEESWYQSCCCESDNDSELD